MTGRAFPCGASISPALGRGAGRRAGGDGQPGSGAESPPRRGADKQGREMLLAEIAKDRGTEDREGQTEGGREGGTFALCRPWRSRGVCWGDVMRSCHRLKGNKDFKLI